MNDKRYKNISRNIKEFPIAGRQLPLESAAYLLENDQTDARACKRIPDINLPTSALHSAAKNAETSVYSTILPAILASSLLLPSRRFDVYDNAINVR